MNLYKSNSLAGKFTKAKSLKIQGELHEKEEKLKKRNFNGTEGSRQRRWSFPEELEVNV